MFVERQVEDRVTLRQPSHILETFEAISKYRKEGILCDVIFLVEGKKFHAHKNVMASCSEYFKVMFTGTLAEAKQTEIKLESISSEVFEQVINFIYEGRFTMDISSVVDMLHASSLLLLKDIENECFQFMKRNLNISNCLRLRNIGLSYGSKELVLKCTDYIKKNFENLIEENEALNLDLADMKTLLSFDDITCKTEDMVADFLQKWWTSKFDIEVNEVKLLLKTIRFQYLSKGGLCSLQSAIKDLTLKHSLDFTKIFNSEQKLQSRAARRQSSECRTSQKIEEVVFCLGKRGDTYIYHMPTKRFRRLEKFPSNGQPGELCVYNNKVYVSGSVNVSPLHPYCNNFLFSFDVDDAQWSQLPSMEYARSRQCVAVLQDKLYILGGKNIEERIENLERSVECYDIQTKTWSQKAHMIDARIGASATASNKNVYVVGGESVRGAIRGQKTAERYCPRKEKWEKLPNLNHERIGSCAVYFNDKVFVFGGGNGIFELNSFEFLDHNEKQWTVVTVPFNTPVNTAVSMNDKILAFGSSTWGDDIILQYSVLRRRGVHWKQIKDFIHVSHRTKSMKYAVISLANYEIDKKIETQCDCNYYEADSSTAETAPSSSSIVSDDEEWMDFDPWGVWL